MIDRKRNQIRNRIGEDFRLQTFQLRSKYTYQVSTAAYKDILIRMVFFEGLKTLLSSRDFLNSSTATFLSRIIFREGGSLSISVGDWLLGKNGIWAIFPRV